MEMIRIKCRSPKLDTTKTYPNIFGAMDIFRGLDIITTM